MSTYAHNLALTVAWMVSLLGAGILIFGPIALVDPSIRLKRSAPLIAVLCFVGIAFSAPYLVTELNR